MGHDLRVASPSFAQVNTPQTEQMMHLVRERLHLTRRELLVDAYAGVGTFAVLLSSSVRKVIAIEESAAAVKDAAVKIVLGGLIPICDAHRRDERQQKSHAGGGNRAFNCH